MSISLIQYSLFKNKTYWGKIPKITSNDATLLTPQCKTVTLQFSNHASFTPSPSATSLLLLQHLITIHQLVNDDNK